MQKRVALALLSSYFCVLSAADLAAPNAAGVAYGHFHTNATDLAVARKFWTALGAEPAPKLAANDVYRAKNTLILVRQQKPSSGSEATVVNHIGFRIKDLEKALKALEAEGFKPIQTAEAIAKNHKCNVIGPDDLNVELVSDPALDAPIGAHHVHFYNTAVEDTRAWYVKTFGAIAGKRDQFLAADVPGVNLSFSQAKGMVKPTQGSAIDHIGFEVRDLDTFCKKLEASGIKFDRPYAKVPALGIAIAFFTDPFGTYIELTEGLGSK